MKLANNGHLLRELAFKRFHNSQHSSCRMWLHCYRFKCPTLPDSHVHIHACTAMQVHVLAVYSVHAVLKCMHAGILDSRIKFRDFPLLAKVAKVKTVRKFVAFQCTVCHNGDIYNKLQIRSRPDSSSEHVLAPAHASWYIPLYTRWACCRTSRRNVRVPMRIMRHADLLCLLLNWKGDVLKESSCCFNVREQSSFSSERILFPTNVPHKCFFLRARLYYQ